MVCNRGTCTAFQGQFEDGYVRLTVPGGRYDVVVARG
jgi:hypothetical protein